MSYHYNLHASNIFNDNFHLKDASSGSLKLKAPTAVTDYTITLPPAVPPINSYLRTSNTTGALEWTAVSGSGESNTGSNLGTQLGKVFKQKIGIDFQLRSIGVGSTKLTVVNSTDDILFDLDQDNITGTGILDSGSITDNFGSINVGSSPVTTTGTITGGTLTAANVNLMDSTLEFTG